MIYPTLRVCLLLVLAFVGIESHVRVMKPPSRSSIWRDESFQHLNPPINYNDDAVWCVPAAQEEDISTCAPCGDAANAAGGEYAQGIITGEYLEGQVWLSIGIGKPKRIAIKEFSYMLLKFSNIIKCIRYGLLVCAARIYAHWLVCILMNIKNRNHNHVQIKSKCKSLCCF
jgi:hypothetical protein